MGMLARGEKARHFGETKMNVNSSRSHTVFRMVSPPPPPLLGTGPSYILIPQHMHQVCGRSCACITAMQCECVSMHKGVGALTADRRPIPMGCLSVRKAPGFDVREQLKHGCLEVTQSKPSLHGWQW